MAEAGTQHRQARAVPDGGALHSDFLPRAGEAGTLISAMAAERPAPSGSPANPGAIWPRSPALRQALALVLPSPAPMVLFWGNEFLAFYNDALARLIGARHPRAMGRPGRESWAEQWDTLGPMLDWVRDTGEAVQVRDHSFATERREVLEEVFLDLSCSAVREGLEVAGVLCVIADTTERVLAGRRLGGLRAMAQPLATAGGTAEACAAALSVLAAETPDDLAWGRVLLREGTGWREVATHGEAPQGLPPPDALPDLLPRLLPGSSGDASPPELPGTLVLPLLAAGRVAGAFLAGLNPRRPLAGEYGSYLGLAAGQLSLAVSRLRQQEEEREDGALFRDVADHAPVMIWMAGADGRCTYLTRRWREFTGQAPGASLGRGWLNAVHPQDREAVEAAFARAAEVESAFRVEYRLRAADGHYVWVIDVAAPRLDPEGRFAGFVGAVLDISERRRDEEARELLARELSHRIKNVFMVTGGLAALTARGNPAAEAFAANLQSRLRALSLAHDLARPEPVTEGKAGSGAPGSVPRSISSLVPGGAPVSAAPSSGAASGPLTLHELLRALLAPYRGGGRVAIVGEDRPMGYAAASALALVLHEQATNAVKYGALSRSGGRLRIATGPAGGGTFRLDWTETGGPPVSGPPSRSGFGTALAARSLAGQVRGRVTHDWRPEGLSVRVEMPEALLAGQVPPGGWEGALPAGGSGGRTAEENG